MMPESGFPDLTDDALAKTLETWLLPYLVGMTRRSDLGALDLGGALSALIPHELLRQLEKLAPARLTIPSGATAPIDYSGEVPTLRSRLQEMFGLKETPRIAGGAVALRIELLSPAHRPIAVTQDLASFWAGGYAGVRSDLRGRYPKHLWPEDPANASPPRPGKTR
jgi:ATP-dependent helicase HrpB